ncbi:MAG: hypothetical protein IJG23_02245 [Clostridia bacterium]|nr:hypothetical protein [Clostridia bacterium]
MPTFKADYAEFDPQRDTQENLLNLINQYNDLVGRISRCVNNLDEDNLNIDLTKQTGGNNNG